MQYGADMVTLHQHNAETYQKIVSLFAESDCVCAVQPMGTEKNLSDFEID